MLLIPCVDIQNGKAVRLYEGNPDAETVYYDSPLEAALHWQEQGSKFLHVVDLDAATGRGENRAALAKIANKLTIPFEVGGGIRSFQAAKDLLVLGAKRVVIGTMAIKQPEVLERLLDQFGPERVLVSLDAKGLDVVVSGWAENSAQTVPDVAKTMHDLGVTTLIYTDVRRDGTLAGLDMEMVSKVRESWSGFLIAGGGIASDADIEGLQALGVEGAITGKAVYEGKITLSRWFV